METVFTPVSAAIGGFMIGLAALLLLWLNGRIAGVSGILGAALSERGPQSYWRWFFLAGLLAGGAVVLHTVVGVEQVVMRASPVTLVIAGLLVGYGTRLGSGCTSGHGVCGIGRLSPRSLAATAVFMAVAVATVFVQRHLLG